MGALLRGTLVREDGTLYPRAFRVLCIVSAVLLGVAAFHLGKNGRLRVSGARASGRVVQLDSRRPVVEFRTATGQPVRFTSTATLRRSPAYYPGNDVAVVYLPASPDQAEIDDPRFLWGPGGMVLFLGAMLLAVTLAGRPRS